jgi:hypothetical protein
MMSTGDYHCDNMPIKRREEGAEKEALARGM